MLERRSGLARGVRNRLIEDDRHSNTAILAGAQWRVDTVLSASGFSAYQMVFGPSPVDLFGWTDGAVDMLFAQDTSLAGQCANRRKLRMRAQEATLKEIANSKLRRPLARNRTSN